MLVIAFVMLAIIVVAVLLLTFVAFPHRGEEVPAAPWLGEAMTRAVGALPTLDNTEDQTGEHAGHHSALRAPLRAGRGPRGLRSPRGAGARRAPGHQPAALIASGWIGP